MIKGIWTFKNGNTINGEYKQKELEGEEGGDEPAEEGVVLIQIIRNKYVS